VTLVSAVVVNWNTALLLDRCLRALHEGAPRRADLEVVVVDNGSSDGSQELVRDAWPGVRMIENATNEGYQRANNRGIAATSGEFVALVNSDAFVLPGAVDALLDRMDTDPRAAVVGPRLMYGDGHFQRWTAGREPGLGAVASFYLFLERVHPGAAARSLYLRADTREAFRPDWVSSACMLVRRTAFDDVGLLDDRYFCHMDDVDLCRRARDAGWHVWYEPAAEVVHLMGASTAATTRPTHAVSSAAIRNFNDYVRRRDGATVGALTRGMEVVGFGARAASYAARALVHRESGSGAQARAHLRNVRLSLQRGSV
jgi:N-acetylglucosaminyl-diphospho-decaprenol L-rhamnosyltransferase